MENPRQVAAYRYSEEFGPRPPSFARATVVPAADAANAGPALLLVGGTAAVVGERSVSDGGVEGQMEETLRNLARGCHLAAPLLSTPPCLPSMRPPSLTSRSAHNSLLSTCPFPALACALRAQCNVRRECLVYNRAQSAERVFLAVFFHAGRGDRSGSRCSGSGGDLGPRERQHRPGRASGWRVTAQTSAAAPSGVLRSRLRRSGGGRAAAPVGSGLRRRRRGAVCRARKRRWRSECNSSRRPAQGGRAPPKGRCGCGAKKGDHRHRGCCVS